MIFSEYEIKKNKLIKIKNKNIFFFEILGFHSL